MRLSIHLYLNCLEMIYVTISYIRTYLRIHTCVPILRPYIRTRYIVILNNLYNVYICIILIINNIDYKIIING